MSPQHDSATCSTQVAVASTQRLARRSCPSRSNHWLQRFSSAHKSAGTSDSFHPIKIKTRALAMLFNDRPLQWHSLIKKNPRALAILFHDRPHDSATYSTQVAVASTQVEFSRAVLHAKTAGTSDSLSKQSMDTFTRIRWTISQDNSLGQAVGTTHF